MPTRILREGILSSRRIDLLSMGAELFYRRLMSVADDYGRYYASIGALRGACWPTAPEKVKETQIAGWLEECCAGDEPLIVLYTVKGCRYLEIQDFRQQTRSKSKYPERLTGDVQVISNCLASDVQLLCTSRSRNSETKSESETETIPASPPRGSRPTATGTRFTIESIPAEWARWASTDCGMDISASARTFEEFRDYWIAQPGAKGRKSDWSATWRNWCRRDRQTRSPTSNGTGFRRVSEATAFLEEIIGRKV